MKKFIVFVVFIFTSSLLAMPYEINSQRTNASELEKLVQPKVPAITIDNIFTNPQISSNDNIDSTALLIISGFVSQHISTIDENLVITGGNPEIASSSKADYAQTNWLKSVLIAGF